MMKGRKRGISKRITATLLTLSLLAAICPFAYAFSSGIVTVMGEKTIALHVMNTTQGWCVCADDLAEAGGLRASINAAQKKVSIYKEEPFTLLYTADESTYLENDGRYYVPFQAASVAAGLRFYESKNGKELRYEILRTPKELMAELTKNVFGVRQYRLEEIICSTGVLGALTESLARVYAMLSPMSLTAVAKAVSGEASQERYTEALAAVIASDEDDLSALSALADVNKLSLKADKVLDVYDFLYENSRKYVYWLNNANKRQIDFWSSYDLIASYGKYYNAREFLDEYAKVSKILDVQHFFEVLLYIESVTEAEESMIQAMNTVLSVSNNSYIRTAATTVGAARYGAGKAIELGSDAVFHACQSQVDELFGELAFGEPGWKQKLSKFLVTTVMDFGLHTKDKANAILYLPIYSAFQQELSRYFYGHSGEYDAENMRLLRSVGILYLRSAIAEYKKFEFDSDLKETAARAKKELRDELTVLLSYGEKEYAPDFTNQEVMAKLGQYWKEEMIPAAVEATPDQKEEQLLPAAEQAPTREELFDERWWHLCYGSTIVENQDALFRMDGSFTAHYMNDYLPAENGTYTYKNGKLTLGDRDNGIDYVWNGSGFVSVRKYEQGIGGDYSGHYTITPLAYVPELPNEKKETVLSDGIHYGKLKEWTDITMTVEIMEYQGRSTESLNYILGSVGEVFTLDISGADVWLEEPWSEDYNEIFCSSIEEAMNTPAWGGSSTVGEQCSKQISFTVNNGEVSSIIILYAA